MGPRLERRPVGHRPLDFGRTQGRAPTRFRDRADPRFTMIVPDAHFLPGLIELNRPVHRYFMVSQLCSRLYFFARDFLSPHDFVREWPRAHSRCATTVRSRYSFRGPGRPARPTSFSSPASFGNAWLPCHCDRRRPLCSRPSSLPFFIPEADQTRSRPTSVPGAPSH